MDIDIRCESASVVGLFDTRDVLASLTGVDVDLVVDAMDEKHRREAVQRIGASEVVKAIDDDELLEEIGEAAAIRYFGLKVEDCER